MIFKLKGVVQHYDWGGYDFIPSLLEQNNTSKQPWAEYWMGVHPKGSAKLEINGPTKDLSALLSKFPEWLGEKVQQQFGGLPFLFKILDVRKMLSIQLHPTIEKAQQGFQKEEALGIPRLAANRNYKDQNHKPEVMVALTDFWLLHGFQSEEKIEEAVLNIPAWTGLLSYLKEGGIMGLYQQVMSISQAEVDALLEPLFQELKRNKTPFNRSQPAYWAWQAFQDYTKEGHYDRGIFSIYFFNLLHLKKGEGIFQGAGIPHAYLEGANIELMANSDNVLRGGLTPKHIDVPELLDNIIAKAIEPNVLKIEANRQGITHYPIPVDDFSLNKIDIEAGKSLKLLQKGPAVFLIMEGKININRRLFSAGEPFFVNDGTYLEILAKDEDVVLFRAYVY